MFLMKLEFWRCERGGAALLFALLLPVLIVMVGGAIDYSRAARLEQDLQDAAEAAVLAAANDGRLALLSNDISGEQELVAYVEQAAIQRFQAKMSSRMSSDLGSLTPAAALVDGEIRASVAFSGDHTSSFLQLIGVSEFNVGGESHASVSLPRYFHITLAFDISASMGIGATSADQDMMLDDFGCAFACHMRSNSTYDRATAIGATMRLDEARMAALHLLETLENTARFTDQYTFSVYVYDNWTRAIVPPGDPNAHDLAYVASKINNEVHMNNFDGGTNTARAMRTIAQDLPASGTGTTPANRKQFLTVFTDGVENAFYIRDDGSYSHGTDDSAVYNDPHLSAWSNVMYALDPDYACTELKSKNIEIFMIHASHVRLDYSRIQWGHKYNLNFVYGELEPIIPDRFSACAGDPANVISSNSIDVLETSITDLFERKVMPLRLY